MTSNGVPPPPPVIYDIEEDTTDIFADMDDWDLGLHAFVYADIKVEGADIEAHLTAIHDFVGRLRRDDKELAEKIEKIEARSNDPYWNERGDEYLIEHYHSSGYQDAAHSMAAVAVLTAFFQSMFNEAFSGIRKWLEREDRMPVTGHSRWQMPPEKQWDCQFVSTKKDQIIGSTKNIARGIVELAEATGLAGDLPSDLHATLGALFAYRNKMLHCGFEWPAKERNGFAKTIAEKHWPEKWFSQWTSDGKPFMFYLTDAYIDHCLKTINDIIPGIGKFLRKNRRPRR
jgi:hypothetical protein